MNNSEGLENHHPVPPPHHSPLPPANGGRERETGREWVEWLGMMGELCPLWRFSAEKSLGHNTL